VTAFWMVFTTWRGGTPVLYATHRIKSGKKEGGKSGKKEDNLIDDFRRRLSNKKKSRRFVERWRILRKSNKKAYDFLKKVGRR
jgi:hypothetical protein